MLLRKDPGMLKQFLGIFLLPSPTCLGHFLSSCKMLRKQPDSHSVSPLRDPKSPAISASSLFVTVRLSVLHLTREFLYSVLSRLTNNTSR
jgi:hypothetical protein